MGKRYCQICGRQIVSYAADNAKYVGPASDGCLVLVGGYACPPCTREEQELETLGYYNTIENQEGVYGDI